MHAHHVVGDSNAHLPASARETCTGGGCKGHSGLTVPLPAPLPSLLPSQLPPYNYSPKISSGHPTSRLTVSFPVCTEAKVAEKMDVTNTSTLYPSLLVFSEVDRPVQFAFFKLLPCQWLLHGDFYYPNFIDSSSVVLAECVFAVVMRCEQDLQCIWREKKEGEKKYSHAGNRTRAAWVKATNPSH